ncbi:MAG: S8 family serine peptidase [Bdellovibrionota bacterium]
MNFFRVTLMSTLLYGFFPLARAQKSTSGLFTPQGVLILDGALDIEHPDLKESLQLNQAELLGQPGIDDDANGFVDDVYGWNVNSHDANVYPDWIKNLYVLDHERARFLLDKYGRYVCGDYTAKVYFMQHQQDWVPAWTLSSQSHATHLAGLIATESRGAAKIKSLDIFVSSAPPSSLVPRDALAGLRKSFQLFQSLDSNAASPFDDEAQTKIVIDESNRYLSTESHEISNYVKASRMGVVNASLHVSELAIENFYDQMWKDDFKKRGLPPGTQRNAHQQLLFQSLVNASVEAYRHYWNEIVGNNPEVVFVVAAGNDNRNNDEEIIFPAQLSTLFDNVITVGAVDVYGDKTRFSNKGTQSVLLGAPGVCIKSTAPGGLYHTMTGTSQSTASVSGVIAKLRALRPDWSPKILRETLLATVSVHDRLSGYFKSSGELNSDAAIQAASSP